MPLPLLSLLATPHPALLYGNMSMQQEGHPLAERLSLLFAYA